MAGLPDCPAAPKHPSAERSRPRDPCVSTNLWVPDPHRHSLLWVPDPHRHRFGSSDRDGVAVKEERFSSDEQILEGGNMNPSVVRVADSVRRAAGPWTGAVHALLRHLEKQGYPAPRPLGFDSEGREMLSFVPGRVAYPDALASTESADGLRRAGALIADYHRAQASFHPPAGVPWRCEGRDPTGSEEVLAHNDLAPWNLIVRSAEWTFIDWDLVAPGRRLWDLSWALHSFVGLWPDSPISSSEVVSRIAAFCDGPRSNGSIDPASSTSSLSGPPITQRCSAGALFKAKSLSCGWSARVTPSAGSRARRTSLLIPINGLKRWSADSGAVMVGVRHPQHAARGLRSAFREGDCTKRRPGEGLTDGPVTVGVRHPQEG